MYTPDYLLEQPPAHGTTVEVAPGVRWLQMPLPMDLDHINLYLLETPTGWWVVDTGMKLGPTQALWEQIFEQELGGKQVEAVLCTHMHPDHIGMAGWLCEHWRVPFYISGPEYFAGRTLSAEGGSHFSWTQEQHMRRCGYEQAQIDKARESSFGFGEIITEVPRAFRRLSEGDILQIGEVRWRVVMGYGHSPEHACLYSESLNVLISGDQVIPKITTNISVNGSEPEANPMKGWFQSLERFLEVLPGDALVLPAHNAPFHGLHERLRYLIEHHEEHLLALEEACASAPRTAMELLPVLFKRELTEHHLGLAVGECLAHLNYLHQRGQLLRDESETGRYLYTSCDETLEMRLRKQAHHADQSVPVQV